MSEKSNSNESIHLRTAAMVAEIVGAIAVVISLIFVGVQLSRNTDELVAATHLDLVNILNANDNWFQDPKFAETIVRSEKDPNSLNEAERQQVIVWAGQRLYVCEVVFNRNQEGLIEKELWAAWAAGCADILKNPIARIMWEERRHWYAADFAEWFSSSLERSK